MRCKPSRVGCKPSETAIDSSLHTLVRSYQIHNRPHSEGELAFFRNMPSLELAIYHAAFAINERDKRFDHQRRLKRSSLNQANALLSDATKRIKAARSFHELHELLLELLSPVRGLGELYVYDTTLRLGSFLGL